MRSRRREVGAFEAKTRLSHLLREAERGRASTIYRRGKPVARLVPVEPEEGDWQPDLLLVAFRAIRNRIDGSVDVRELIEEGRRY